MSEPDPKKILVEVRKLTSGSREFPYRLPSDGARKFKNQGSSDETFTDAGSPDRYNGTTDESVGTGTGPAYSKGGLR